MWRPKRCWILYLPWSLLGLFWLSLLDMKEETSLVPNEDNATDFMPQRVQRVRSVCQELTYHHYQVDLRNYYLVPMEPTPLLWCNVFKAASTSWAFVMNQLANKSASFLLRTRDPLINLARKAFPLLSLEEVGSFVKNHRDRIVIFLVVRHPFERLVSAYKDKIMNPTHFSFHEKLGRAIIGKFRPGASLKAIPRSERPSFAEFVSHVLEEDRLGHEQDLHWTPISSLCDMCSNLMAFNHIIKFETFERDEKMLLDKANIRAKVRTMRLNAQSGRLQGHGVAEYFATLTHSQLISLCQMFRLDFMFFDYHWPSCE